MVFILIQRNTEIVLKIMQKLPQVKKLFFNNIAADCR